jgi:hypothetical protein
MLPLMAPSMSASLGALLVRSSAVGAHHLAALAVAALRHVVA